MRQILERLETVQKDILVVGDVILDRYIYGKVERISPEAPIPVLLYQGEKEYPGGAANVAANVAALGSRASVLTVVGEDPEGSRLCTILDGLGLDIAGVIQEKGRKTTRKTRMVSQSFQQLLRVDDETTEDIRPETENKLKEYIDRNIDQFDLVMISDYSKGVVTSSLCAYIIDIAARYGKRVLVDPKSADFMRYRGAYLVKPNRKELSAIFRGQTGSMEEMAASALKVKDMLQAENIVVTLGEEGMLLADKENRIKRIPCKTRKVFDVTGAGDTSLAAMGVCLAQGEELEDSLRLANLAAGIKVQKDGVAVVTLEELRKEMEPDPSFPDKILKDPQALRQVVAKAREQRKTIVFTNGCFDLFHFGHLSYLSKARSLGDMLIVGVNSDASVRRIKGEKRPVVPENDRMSLLAGLAFVDYVVLFDEDTPSQLIEAVQPDILVKGADWRPEEVVGREIVQARGGRVELIPLEEGRSTTSLIERIVQFYGGNSLPGQYKGCEKKHGGV